MALDSLHKFAWNSGTLGGVEAGYTTSEVFPLTLLLCYTVPAECDTHPYTHSNDHTSQTMLSSSYLNIEFPFLFIEILHNVYYYRWGDLYTYTILYHMLLHSVVLRVLYFTTDSSLGHVLTKFKTDFHHKPRTSWHLKWPWSTWNVLARCQTLLKAPP